MSVGERSYGGDHADFRGGVFLGETIGVQVVVPPGEVVEAAAALPGRVVGFTGRGVERERLLGALEAGDVIVSAVSGLGGIGKTALAVEAAHEAVARGWFPGGVLFLDLHGYDREPVGAEHALQYLLGALGVRPESMPGTLDERAALYRSVLATRPAALVLADNASSVDQVRHLLPGDSRHRVLVTSRDRLPQLKARLVPLTQLAPEESYELLDRALRIADPDDARAAADDTRQLADLCGHLPLALQIVAALLAEDSERPVAELVEELAGLRNRLTGLDDGARSVRAAFDLSYRRLTSEQARVLRLISVAPGVDVGEGVLMALADAEVLPLEELRGLRRAHLVERVGKRWWMHDLVREFGAEILGESEERGARERVLEFYRRGSRAADAWLRRLPGEERPPLFSGREEAVAWLDAERPGLVAAVRRERGKEFAQDDMSVALDLAEYLNWRRAFDDLCLVMEVSREEARATGQTYAEAASWYNFGTALEWLSRYEEAIEAYERARALFAEAGSRDDEAAALSSIGSVLAALRRFDEALTAHTRARALHEETGDRAGEGHAWGKLGQTLTRLGRIQEAAEAHTYARDLFVETGDRAMEGAAWSNLGIALRKLGRPQDAITAYDKALALHDEFDDMYEIGVVLHNLALVHEDDNALDRARDAYRRAAEAFMRADEPNLATLCRIRAFPFTADPPEPTDKPTPASPPAHTTAAAPPSPPPPNAPDTAEQ
ncbi:regulatory protein AfsR [Streptomyces acidiscabies]|nr:regulatory protein AfsR [Streptomyces acidiscabies]